MLDGYWLELSAPGCYWLQLVVSRAAKIYWLSASHLNFTTTSSRRLVHHAALSTQLMADLGGKTAREVLHALAGSMLPEESVRNISTTVAPLCPCADDRCRSI